MAYTLNKTEMDFCRSYGHALADAENDFISILQSKGGLSPEIAGKVFDLYVRRKLVKFDRTNRRYSVIHGALLNPEIIKGAANTL